MRLLRNNTIPSIFLSVLLFLVTYFWLGYYYGWLDDVLQDNYFKGIPLFEPIEYFYTVHILLSKMYSGLYHLYPQIPWYGIFFGLWIFLATVNLFIFLSNTFAEFFSARWKLYLVLVFVYFLVWVENVYLINFSRVAILLMGTSILNIHRILQSERIRILPVLYFSLTFLIGILTRPELAFLVLPFLFIYAFWGFTNIKQTLKIIGITILLILLFKGIDISQQPGDVKTKRQAVGHILNITDGLNTYTYNTDSLRIHDIKYRALALYYFPDSSFMNIKSLSEMGPGSAFSWVAVKNVKKNLYSEYKKARYEFEVYHRPMNWLWKTIIYIFFNLFLVGFNLNRLRLKEIRCKFVLLELIYVGCFFSTVFFITLLSKMEDRVLNPAFIIFTIGHVAMWARLNRDKIHKWSKRKKGVIIFVTLILISLQTNGYCIIKREKREELNLKNAFIHELNTAFRDKVFFYDLWTMTLLHQSPLSVINLDPANTHTCYGEYWCNFMPGHYKKLNEFCEATDFLSFYKCLYEKRDKVVFVFSRIDRKELLESYSEQVYGEKIRFREIMPNSSLKKLHYSFLPYYYEFGYYVFDDSFADAKNEEVP